MKKNKKIIVVVISLCLVILFFLYHYSYNGKFAGNTYFHKRYEKTDDAYLHTKMLGDVVKFDKDRIYIIDIVDIKNDPSTMTKDRSSDDFLPDGDYKTKDAFFVHPSYSILRRNITADGMDSIEVISTRKIKYQDKIYIRENNPENIFYKNK